MSASNPCPWLKLTWSTTPRWSMPYLSASSTMRRRSQSGAVIASNGGTKPTLIEPARAMANPRTNALPCSIDARRGVTSPLSEPPWCSGTEVEKRMGVEIEQSPVVDGVVAVTPAVHGDARGRFLETYRRSWFPLGREMVQGNRGDLSLIHI